MDGLAAGTGEHQPDSPPESRQRSLQGRRRRRPDTVRGPRGVVLVVVVFLGAGALGGRPGLAVAGTYLLFLGSYCVLNLWRCRETHCVVTGPGWTLVGLLAVAAALTPSGVLSWYTVGAASLATFVVFVAGYGLEWAVATLTGRHRLG